MQIDVCFVFFRTTDLRHLDAAWFSLSKQDFTNVSNVYFLDNNTEFEKRDVFDVLCRYPLPVPVYCEFDKHGDSTKTQSWSVNRVCRDLSPSEGSFIFFSRSDYILDFDCLRQFRQKGEEFLLNDPASKFFISGWCWQMAYDREARNIDDHVDIEQYGWREKGMEALLQHPYAFRFHETDQDAGVWFTNKSWMKEAGWMNEQMSSWGYQMSTFQRAMRWRVGVTMHAIQSYLFAHQHHYAVRDFAKASDEYVRFGGGI